MSLLLLGKSGLPWQVARNRTGAQEPMVEGQWFAARTERNRMALWRNRDRSDHVQCEGGPASAVTTGGVQAGVDGKRATGRSQKPDVAALNVPAQCDRGSMVGAGQPVARVDWIFAAVTMPPAGGRRIRPLARVVDRDRHGRLGCIHDPERQPHGDRERDLVTMRARPNPTSRTSPGLEPGVIADLGGLRPEWCA